ncbi:chemotaxis protein CheB [Salinisphaera sp. Q1T1-3]|uniref:chemotaxis protein CheB n=1 Tax=Salinisphaera sp. Q1T1-3 TaxID=2321229 RepID=UPI001313FA35|nr:chemotaxis protein CheB [Salinisphaera sp. Q1T1-3]
MRRARCAALAIGGSAGSLPVIRGLIAALPCEMSLAVVVCMHTSAHVIDDLCAVLGDTATVSVVEAIDGAAVEPGRVYIAPGGYHLLVERKARFALCAGQRINHVRPAIDVLFETMAEAYRGRLAGILLSGRNHDGAIGLTRIRALGGHVRVQDPETAEAPEMPRAALALAAPDGQNSPDELQKFVRALAWIGPISDA